VSRSRRGEVGSERRGGSVVRTAAHTALAVVMMLACQAVTRGAGEESRVEHRTFYRTTHVDGHSIFYREAGPKDAATLLLLHGLPSSSRMFEPLFARLSDQYHLVAPDYPGFSHKPTRSGGHSE
jgi:hypothetical protein